MWVLKVIWIREGVLFLVLLNAEGKKLVGSSAGAWYLHIYPNNLQHSYGIPKIKPSSVHTFF